MRKYSSQALKSLQILGGAGGYQTSGEILTQTADGRDLNALWDSFQATIELWNAGRQAVVDFLTYSQVNPVEDVPQISTTKFELASEFGLPRSAGANLGYFSLGFPFAWFDVRESYTWKFLADAGASQVEAIHQSILEADNANVFNIVLKAIFNNINLSANIRGVPYPVYRLYNADGTVPPPYKSNTFDGTHNHYLVSGATVIDSQDLESQLTDLRSHGYSDANGARLVTMVNPAQGDLMRGWRVNVINANAAVAKYDFIPAQGQNLLLANSLGLIGTQPAPTLSGLNVIGSYGDSTIVQEEYIPPGYIVSFATGGQSTLTNPIGIREHANPALRGLRLLAGNQSGYPLQDATYSRGIGAGIRQRGGAVITQLKVSGTYDIPAAYV